jgi:TetR/AcrR family transcriptional regulator
MRGFRKTLEGAEMPSKTNETTNKATNKAGNTRPAKGNRKSKRGAIPSKEIILKTAIDHFVRKGYDGARVDEIVADASTSKNLIYHYFQSKEVLFVAVLDRIYENFSIERGEEWRKEKRPIEGLRKLAGEIFNALANMPEMISILNTENLFKAIHIKKMTHVQDRYRFLLEGIGDLLRRGEDSGDFRAGIDPTQLYISLSSLCYHYISNHYTFSVILGFDLMSPRKMKIRREHAIEMTLRYCLKPSVVAKLERQNRL